MVLALGAAFAVLSAAAGAAELRLDPAAGVQSLWPRADVLRDPTGRWTLGDVESRSNAFVAAHTLQPDPTAWVLRPSVLWFRVNLRGDATQPWYLQVSANVDRAELVYRSPDGHVARTTFGQLIPFDQRPVASLENLAPIPPDALRGGTIYLRTVSRLDDFRILQVETDAYLRGPAHRAEDTFLIPLLLITGMLVALALLNCVLAAMLRDGIYLWYAGALFAFVVYDIAQGGFAWEYLWPQLSIPYDISTYVLMIAFFVLAVVFSRGFLDLPRVAPLLWHVELALLAFVAVEELVYAFAPNLLERLNLYQPLDPLATSALLLVMFWAGVVAWRRGNPLARFYAIAFAGVVIGTTANTSGVYDLIPSSPWTDAAIGLGVAWEAVILSAALADRIRGLDRRAATLQGERDALELVALHDALTGIANRRAFELRLDEEWRRGTRAQTSLAVILVDVDHFKRYNDALGHPRGDRVLRRVARALDGVLHRPEDVVARYGGEEFVAILPNCSRDDAARIADEMRSAVRRLNIPHPTGESGLVSISAGVASTVPKHDVRAAALVSAADRALYAAKRDGRDRIVVARRVVLGPEAG
jgi:diguanylate cyclase (GGDEF)-like protein